MEFMKWVEQTSGETSCSVLENKYPGLTSVIWWLPLLLSDPSVWILVWLLSYSRRVSRNKPRNIKTWLRLATLQRRHFQLEKLSIYWTHPHFPSSPSKSILFYFTPLSRMVRTHIHILNNEHSIAPSCSFWSCITASDPKQMSWVLTPARRYPFHHEARRLWPCGGWEELVLSLFLLQHAMVWKNYTWVPLIAKSWLTTTSTKDTLYRA
jgi:hypothetical protein